MSPDPQYEPDFRPLSTPSGAGDQIWTPTNVQYVQAWQVGVAPESGQMVWKLEFMLNFMGERRPFGILWEEGDSEDQIEDLIGFSAEGAAKMIAMRHEQRGSKLRPEDLALRKNWDVRRQLAGAWREYRRWRKKQRESSTGKTLFEGLNYGNTPSD